MRGCLHCLEVPVRKRYPGGMLPYDHATFRKSVFHAVKETAGIRLVGQAHDSMELVELAEKEQTTCATGSLW